MQSIINPPSIINAFFTVSRFYLVFTKDAESEDHEFYSLMLRESIYTVLSTTAITISWQKDMKLLSWTIALLPILVCVPMIILAITRRRNMINHRMLKAL